MPSILIVDDSPVFLKLLNKLLSNQGYRTVQAKNGLEALEILQHDSFDIMISDICMKPLSGLDLLKQTQIFNKKMCVIMLTACDTLTTALPAMKYGAFDYLTKPFKVEALMQTIRRALEYRNTTADNKPMRIRLDNHKEAQKLRGVVAQSAYMTKVCDTIERIAPTHTTVLICGEPGTGKELAARNLHRYSPRNEQPFLKIDCAALSRETLETQLFDPAPDKGTENRGLFEAAAGGSLYIHEVGTLPLWVQDQLLETLKAPSVIKSRNAADISVRILTSSSVGLEPLVREGSFREELYRRLSTIRIAIPPLRERPTDVLPLISLALQQYVGPDEPIPTLDADAEEILKHYRWPGNVTQLETVIREAFALRIDGVIARASLPADIVNEVMEHLDLSCHRSGEQLKGKALQDLLRKKRPSVEDFRTAENQLTQTGSWPGEGR